MENIVYVKKVDEYEDILKEEHKRIPNFFKKIIFMYKNMFNIITKKKMEEENIWVLPMQEKLAINKIKIFLKKMATYTENIYILSDNLYSLEIYKLMNKEGISFFTGKEFKKYLILRILEYINNVQNRELNNCEVTILVRDISEYSVYLIERLSKIVKSVKIVSSNMYKFKKLEEKLYNEYGIAIQFSNSYKKSLVKSKIIINIDYNKIEINEYEIFEEAIIINISEEDINIKSKLFNGIVINSCDIKFIKEKRDKFKKLNIYNKYNSIILYHSTINKEKNIDKIFQKLDEDKVTILNLIGNNGNINKNEFKNIIKRLDKKLKTE